jgi:hypothetical protein
VYTSCAKAPPRIRDPDPIDNVRAAFKPPADPPPLSLILSGDTHLFEMFAPDDAKVPIQLVAGMSGTDLEDKKDFEPVLKSGALGAPVRENLSDIAGNLWVDHGFGYILLERETSGSNATLYGVDGRGKLRCRLKTRARDTCTTIP